MPCLSSGNNKLDIYLNNCFEHLTHELVVPTSSTKIFVLKCWFGSGTYKLDQKQLVRISTQRYDVMLFTNADSIIIVNLSSCESHCSRPVEVSSEKKYLNIFGSFLFSFSYNCAEITSALLRNTGPGFWPSYLITPSSVPWKCAY